MCSFPRQRKTERSAPLLTQKAGETFYRFAPEN